MNLFLGVLIFFFVVTAAENTNLTVYQYYTNGGISTGLEALSTGFQLNGKNITIQSGAIHYFRVHPSYWRDRLRKLRATGLIAVETYVPWNLHEPQPGVFDFGSSGSDFSEFLDLVQYLKIAQEEDLLVLLRPGPYICAEWEFGGFPSWLLRYPEIKLRTSEQQYIDRVRIYFNTLLPLVKDLQFTNGGPIVAFQVENEYASSEVTGGPDKEYLQILKQLFLDNGVQELLYTSDNQNGDSGSIPEFLRTINFQNNAANRLQGLQESQPDKPTMVMEFWTGWFDWWMMPAAHGKFPPREFANELEAIITFPASFNLYMFHGGTSFGFMNGGNGAEVIAQTFDVTSYDYDAPLSEAGDYTEKYNITAELVAKHAALKFITPERPRETEKVAYQSVNVGSYLAMEDIYNLLSDVRESHPSVVNMEALNTNNGSGQSYGFVWYRKTGLTLAEGDVLKVSGFFHDIGQVLVDGKLQTKVLESSIDMTSFGFWMLPNGSLKLKNGGTTLNIIVENFGRINFGYFAYNQKKGLFDGPVYIGEEAIKDWDVIPLEFKKSFLENLSSQEWKPYASDTPIDVGPALYRLTLNIADQPRDTFLDMSSWKKGQVFVNNFNLGRYNFLGPQRTLFLPAPLLKTGDNQIIIYEQFETPGQLDFSDQPSLSRKISN